MTEEQYEDLLEKIFDWEGYMTEEILPLNNNGQEIEDFEDEEVVMLCVNMEYVDSDRPKKLEELANEIGMAIVKYPGEGTYEAGLTEDFKTKTADYREAKELGSDINKALTEKGIGIDEVSVIDDKGNTETSFDKVSEVFISVNESEGATDTIENVLEPFGLCITRASETGRYFMSLVGAELTDSSNWVY